MKKKKRKKLSYSRREAKRNTKTEIRLRQAQPTRASTLLHCTLHQIHKCGGILPTERIAGSFSFKGSRVGSSQLNADRWMVYKIQHLFSTSVLSRFRK